MIELSTLITISALSLGTLTGCSSSTVKVDTGGVTLLGPKRVKVGEAFTITQPFDADQGTEWRLTRYDRAMVAPNGVPKIEGSEGGPYTRISPFLARAAGETEMVFIKRRREPVVYGVPQPEFESKTIRIKIVP